MKRLPLLLLFFALPLIAAETGYRIVHPDGTVEFTDDPNRGGEQIPLHEAPTIQAPKPGKTISSTSAKEQAKESNGEESSYDSLAITAPQQEQTIWFDGSAIQVSLSIEPQLGKEHSVVISLDGKEIARGRQSSFSLPQVFRGSHTIDARIEDESGATLIKADPVTFFMRQHSIK